MEYIILTETDFFRRINEADNHNELHPAYRDFTDKVIRLCIEGMDIPLAILALTYAETELQFHHKLNEDEANSISGLYIRKALAFVRKTQKFLTPQVPPLSASTPKPKTPQPENTLRWTGKASDLVEMLYGMVEMGCINGGEMHIGELSAFFYSLFGVEAKDCYHIYSDIKLRKNDSRTYFLDKMQEKLNRRMDMDEERERMRK